MNIGVDIRLLARGRAAGIPGYTRELLNYFFSRDDDNSYQLFYNAFSKEPLPSDWLNNARVSVVDRKLPNRLLDFSARLFKTPRIEYFLPEAELIFSPHFNSLATKRPRIITFHDLSFLQFPSFFSRKQLAWHWLQDYRRQAREADGIIAVSEFTKSDLVNLLDVDSKKIRVIPLGVSSEFFPSAGSSASVLTVKQKYHLDKPFLLYLGALEARKNVVAIIQAFSVVSKMKKLSDFNLVLAGRPGFGSKKIFKEAKESGVSDRIIFLHNVLDSERPALYSLARTFIYPSFFEGFGFPPLEAQAAQTPVIGADRTSLVEVLIGSALLVDPWRVGELADAIVALETDSGLRAKIIKAGNENAELFTWSSAANKTLEFFADIYGRR
ncbi:MAG: hypothetical protein COU10_01870 [Candidatus Harrisonbacteria bacterium CG10_big_fil_rev_8_21_14_0_10_45_28]|uniref:Glycosyltransferase family 1 protein n=1 Tax=Candidatus Harrisonbacteria bacterium CG10_big_fil_rev_8_21_14_0_10_45_28 TaxID=1974586 RepID=A0A2H0UNE5_9BACT|nr:MAG: hypothetical protein COU10_01870 [Candidatus Harrisonbacteria bacterium CG10_big_fil_rev_8_21_14_0_10_45_28]